jgi:hypothetical protein
MTSITDIKKNIADMMASTGTAMTIHSLALVAIGVKPDAVDSVMTEQMTASGDKYIADAASLRRIETAFAKAYPDLDFNAAIDIALANDLLTDVLRRRQ